MKLAHETLPARAGPAARAWRSSVRVSSQACERRSPTKYASTAVSGGQAPPARRRATRGSTNRWRLARPPLSSSRASSRACALVDAAAQLEQFVSGSRSPRRVRRSRSHLQRGQVGAQVFDVAASRGDCAWRAPCARRSLSERARIASAVRNARQAAMHRRRGGQVHLDARFVRCITGGRGSARASPGWRP